MQLSYAQSYFEAIRYVAQSPETQLYSTIYSCNGHLIRRIITQNPGALVELLDLAMPTVFEGLGSTKSSIRDTSTSLLNDVWLVCPDKLDYIFRELGLCNPSPEVVLKCLEILLVRVQKVHSLTFKLFTSSVVALLAHPTSEIRTMASKVLIAFFKTAREAAKEDLSNEMAKQKIDSFLVKHILTSVGFATETSQPTDQNGKQNSSTKALNADFYFNDSKTKLEDLQPESCTVDKFKRDIASMIPFFEGKETEQNWIKREESVSKLRALIRGNIAKDYPDQFVLAIKQMSDGIMKAANSLRTVLSSSTCQFIKEAFTILGQHLDSLSEYFFSNTIKFSALTKKITSQHGMMAANSVIANTSYSPKYLYYIQISLNDKNTQPRHYAAQAIRLIMNVYQNLKNNIDASGGREILEKCIVRGLTDPNASVKEEMRLAFWGYNELWPSHGSRVLEKLDYSVKRALERVNPNSQSIPTTTRNGAHSSAALRTFITQTREKVTADPPKNVIPRNDAKAGGRLGMPQRISRPGSANQPVTNTRSMPWQTNNFTKPTEATNIRANPLRTSFESAKIKAPLLKSEPPTIVANNQTENSPQKLLDLLASTDPLSTETGAKRLVELLKNKNSKSAASSLPHPDQISRALHKLFSKQRIDPIFNSSVIILTEEETLPLIAQFVRPTELALGILGTRDATEDGGYVLLEKILDKVDGLDKRLSFVTYLISQRHETLKKTCNLNGIEKDVYSLRLLQTIDNLSSKMSLDSEIVENIKLLGAYLNSVDQSSQIYKLLQSIKTNLGYQEPAQKVLSQISPPNTVQETTQISSRNSSPNQENINETSVQVEAKHDIKRQSIDHTTSISHSRSGDITDDKVVEIGARTSISVHQDETRDIKMDDSYSKGLDTENSYNSWQSFETQIHEISNNIGQINVSRSSNFSVSEILKNMESKSLTLDELNHLIKVAKKTQATNSQEANDENQEENNQEYVDEGAIVNHTLLYLLNCELIPTNYEMISRAILLLSKLLEDDKKSVHFSSSGNNEKVVQNCVDALVRVQIFKSILQPAVSYGGLNFLTELASKLNKKEDGELLLNRILHMLSTNSMKSFTTEQYQFCLTGLNIVLTQFSVKPEFSFVSNSMIIGSIGDIISQAVVNPEAQIRKTGYNILITLNKGYLSSPLEKTETDNHDLKRSIQTFVFNKLGKQSLALMDYMISHPSN